MTDDPYELIPGRHRFGGNPRQFEPAWPLVLLLVLLWANAILWIRVAAI